ncbi:pyruvate kinase [Caproiciproducens galactitolivorans]|uniref:Pyruvate kinase n=1 Tax=Caproiciproducens galactitolivorans TaxID=642589 RepID=A0A4Z0YA46_9FIRM|nr:pyruvate kinase [Caproiciproducens galactitolivorans]QEY33918.1 pyruvate kinase [Caproiciproducens galactitolivorans]TGJ76121.1 pyruvate kinase [Caproiciproducens galactitolivorans]
MRKTKIICTLGPATDNGDVLRQLMLAGMDVARLNFSHQTAAEQKVRADAVKKLRSELGLPVALLLDTKGPEIRLKEFSKPKVTLNAGDKFTLTNRDIVGNETIASVTFDHLPQEVVPGAKILIDDGLIELKVESRTDTDIYCTVINGGDVSAHKGINVPGSKLSLPFISEKDKEDIAFAVKEDFDFIAASFTRSAQDILDLRTELEKHNCHKIRIIAKIENSEGVDNIDEIIRVSDGIMVARGDLGVEIPLEEVPVIQKKLIKKGYNAGKQVITATQMLDSMMKNPRPTRAETSDVANAIYDGTSAIMLSGETAAGKYPIAALRMMATIAERTERDIDYQSRFRKRDFTELPNVTSAISHATCTTAQDLGAVAIITVSKSGRTARMISKYRPECPIISGTTDETVQRQMNLSWGVVPILVDEKDNTDELFDHVVDVARSKGLLKNGDLVVITAGVPLGISGTTNLLKVHLVGDVLVSGIGVTKGAVCGNLCVCKDEDTAIKTFKEGDILVIPQTSNRILNIIKKASGIITENGGMNSHAAIVGLALDKPVIVAAEHATQILKSGTTVTLDAARAIVFSGKEKCGV